MKKSLLALTLLAALPFAASAADGLSYNYVQGGYVATNGDADADGWGLDGSVAIHPNFHLFGGYNNQKLDDSNFDIDQWRVGVGYNHEIAPTVDLVTRVAYEKFDPGYNLDLDGWSAEVGARAALTPQFEGYAMAGYEDFEDTRISRVDGDFYGRVGAQYKFNQNWGVSTDVKFADGDTQWFVGPRLTW
ncbi:Ax21 family sulfation-dependent quorum factor [Luteimonas cucumeris]|uniref:Ax21 family sulfation-dependent quorum factor n=1 Tax=Luteimonas cucumeris TaxID=985012 RepID=A0A562LDQ6_9GAMM|nr:Ax21 family protein [Luteimonas cucumeris]TWI05781.1 Ax21 family sulfation-dependent quorum factor [Luteimonas cucumeris]